MADVRTELEEALESAGFDVDRVSENRDTVRVEIQADDADAGELRSVVESTCGESAVLGLDVSHETTGDDTVGTVVSFRYRP